MTNVFLISEAKIRQFTSLNDSVDSSLIKNSIRTAQDYHLQSIIGTKLYDKILADVPSGSLAGDYKTLVDDYVQDFLLYATYYETLEEIFIRPRNNGLLTPQGGDNSASVDLETYNVKRNSVENKYTYYSERLTNYLIEEEAKYPELNPANKLYEQDPDYSVKYKNPFVLQGTRAAEIKKMGIKLYDSRYKQYPQ